MQRVSRHSFFGLLFACLAASAAAHADASNAPRDARVGTLDLGRLPLAFEANVGQFDRHARFVARGRNETAFITDDSLVLVRSGSGPERAALRLRFVGSRHRAKPEGFETLPGRSNYLIGNKARHWHTDVPHYARVVRRGAYPGIDIAYYQGKGGIEYDLIAAPGADPSQVRLAIEGADRVELADNGDLVLHTALGEIRQHKPIVYQGEHDAPEPVDGAYRLVAAAGRVEVRFELGAYDPSRALVLDPTLDFATFFGGNADDYISGVALDANDDIYITGSTISDAATFPETAGAYQTTKAASYDGFVAKIKASGMELVYATYIGGNNNDYPNAITVDSNGQAAIGGETTSTTYPTASAVQGTNPSGGNTGIVTKLNASGNGLVFSTYLGGATGAVAVYAIATDPSLNTYVTGKVISASDFPTGATPSPFQSAISGLQDAFAVKYAPNGSRIYGTLLGSNFERGNGIAADAAGSAYVVGTIVAASINGVVATTIGTADDLNGNVMIAKFNPSGSALTYLTRIGGSGFEEGTGGALDPNGNVFFTGRSYDDTVPLDLPSTPAPPSGTNVALFGALNAAGNALTGPGLTWYGNATATSGSCDAYGAYGKSIAIVPSANLAYIAGLGCPADKFPVVNPVPGLGCTPSCNSDTNRTNSFIASYSYSPPAAKPVDAGDASKSVAAPPPPPTLQWSGVYAGDSGTSTNVYWLGATSFGDVVIGGGTYAALGTKDAMNPNSDAFENGYLAKIIQKQEAKITKTFDASTITVGGTTKLSIKVENPNPVEAQFASVKDVLPPTLSVERVAGNFGGAYSSTPPGCNDTLRLFSTLPPFAKGLVNGGVNGTLSVTLPANFICTVVFVLYDEDDTARVEPNTATLTTANAGGSTSTAQLTITEPPAFIWTGAGANNLMSNPANWQGNAIPTAGSSVFFPNTASQLTVVNDLAAPFNLVLAADGYVFTGNIWTLSALVNQGIVLQNAAIVTGVPFGVLSTEAGADVTYGGGIDLPSGTTTYIETEGMTSITGPVGFNGGTLAAGGPGLTRMNGTHTGTAGSIGIADAAVEINANYQPIPLTIDALGTASGSGGVGAIVNQGVLSPGSEASPFASFGAATFQNSGSGTVLSVNAQAAGAFAKSALGPDAVAIGTSSKLMVTGSAALGGTLEVVFDDAPSLGASYVVVSAGSLTGRFARTRAIPGNVFGDVTYTGTTATYTVGLTTGIFRDDFE